MSKPSYIFAPLSLIRSALCPLQFRATSIAELPNFANTVAAIPALGELQVGECLRYESLFPCTDANKHRGYGCQIVAAPFGLSPEDVDALFGICTYAYNLDREEGIPQDGTVTLTVNTMARLAGLSQTCEKDTRRNQSRIFRLSHVKLTNTAVWHSANRRFDQLSNSDLFSIKDMSLLMEPRAPITLQLAPAFLQLLRTSPMIAFDLSAARAIGGPARRRFFYIVAREGWSQRDSTIYDADSFTMHQLGYARHPDTNRDGERRKRRIHELRQLLTEFEARDLIRPCHAWGGYFSTPDRGPLKGRLALRWSRGPAVRARGETKVTVDIEDDPLYDQVRCFRDDVGKPLVPAAYRQLLARHGRQRLQKHVGVITAQKRLMPGSFRRSEVAALVDRVQHDHPFPSWYTPDLSRPTIDFQKVQATPAVQALYDSLSRAL